MRIFFIILNECLEKLPKIYEKLQKCKVNFEYFPEYEYVFCKIIGSSTTRFLPLLS